MWHNFHIEIYKQFFVFISGLIKKNTWRLIDCRSDEFRVYVIQWQMNSNKQSRVKFVPVKSRSRTIVITLKFCGIHGSIDSIWRKEKNHKNAPETSLWHCIPWITQSYAFFCCKLPQKKKNKKEKHNNRFRMHKGKEWIDWIQLRQL